MMDDHVRVTSYTWHMGIEFACQSKLTNVNFSYMFNFSLMYIQDWAVLL
jgi:hypothetical protein